MLRLQLAGADTLAVSSLCASCPHSPAGCCAAPPRVALADIARIVAHGGRDWLLEEIAAGRLVHSGFSWLTLPRRIHASQVLACVYLGPSGCTIPHDRRSATCNYYVCDHALDAAAEDEAPAARAAVDELVSTYARWDAELDSHVRAAFPDGHAFDAAFFDWLADVFRCRCQGVAQTT